MSDTEERSVVYEVGDWIWGTIQGNFNEQQSISQIIVDAVIGMIPVVGDVTGVRDLIASIVRMVQVPEKRREVLEWATVVVLLFALIPVVGGVIKGVGRLLLKVGVKGGKLAAALRQLIELLNRYGVGDARKFIRELDLLKYKADLLGKWRELMQRLNGVLEAGLKRLRSIPFGIADEMIARLEQLRAAFAQVKKAGEEMIPEAVKELNARLKAVQRELYEGTWDRIPDAAGGGAAKSATREAEARLVREADEAKARFPREPKDFDFPPNAKGDFVRAADWPDLTDAKFRNRDTGAYEKIAAFNGPMRARELPPGTRIYRVVTADSYAAGYWWTDHLPKDGEVWRKDLAVTDRFSTNGYYVEYVVPEGRTLHAWEGKTASQYDKTATYEQYLPGGDTQLLIDFKFESTRPEWKDVPLLEQVMALKRKETNWGDTLKGVNVRPLTEQLERLGAAEVDPKKGAGTP